MNPAYERVYHHHVRKTAGTSLNAAFWGLAGLNLPAMFNSSATTRNGLKFVRSDSKLISEGDYFFANSHTPAYRLQLPPHTFTVTILRDPAARVISYYRQFLWARANPTARDVEPAVDKLQLLAKHMGNGFQDFLRQLPPQLLLTQVFMFSERMDPVEAAENALACSAVCFTETFSEDLKMLATTLELELEEKHERRHDEKVVLDEEELDHLREVLKPEYAMFERVREAMK
ncbi:MAG TPA: sulfotransferase family 2 domain-containing protein [Solirubrobacterales bacterium]